MGNESIEKGINLEYRRKLVHACKVREDLGVGITRCGHTFLIGATSYRPDATFGEPPKDDSDHSWSKCKACCEAADYENVKHQWVGWKRTIKRTLAMIQRFTDPPPDLAVLRESESDVAAGRVHDIGDVIKELQRDQ